MAGASAAYLPRPVGLSAVPDCPFGQEVKLSRCQFDVLAALMESRGRLLTFDQIYDRAYGEFTDAGNAYDSTRYFIAEIRRRLSEIAEFDYIENVRGVGYRIRFERTAK